MTPVPELELTGDEISALRGEWVHCEDPVRARHLLEALLDQPLGRGPLVALAAGGAVGLGVLLTLWWLGGVASARELGLPPGALVGGAAGLAWWLAVARKRPMSWRSWLGTILPSPVTSHGGLAIGLPGIGLGGAFFLSAARSPQVLVVLLPCACLMLLWFVHEAGLVLGLALLVAVGHAAALALDGTNAPFVGWWVGFLVPAGYLVLTTSWWPRREIVVVRGDRWVVGSRLERPGAEAVLRIVAKLRGPIWDEARREIEELEREGPIDRDRAIDALGGDRWIERLLVCRELETWSGTEVPALADRYRRRINADGLTRQPPEIQILYRHVARLQARTRRWVDRAHRMICTRCFVRPAVLHDPLRVGYHPWVPFRQLSYVGCRSCRGTDRLVDHPGRIEAVLDAEGETTWDGDGVVVSWLQHRAPLDLDAVSIRRASYADVESFAIQLANDEDPVRGERMLDARCVVDPACGLSENTLVALGRVFPVVEVA